jgi:polysaccharide pyruvyl transferase WcaK-like protein
MRLVLLFDSSVATTNLGDQIIMEAVRSVVVELFPDDYIVTIPTHLYGGRQARKLMRQSTLAIIGGTNLLSSNMFSYRQWKLSLLDAATLKNAVLLGVGWWQYQSPPSHFSKMLLNMALSKTIVHSVRDHYTVTQLRDAGLKNVINTSCPSLWAIKPDELQHASKKNPGAVVTAITAYRKDVRRDRDLMHALRESYSRRYFWPQGTYDLEYASQDLDLDGFCVLRPTLDAFDDVLSSGCDYIGTRLHAGIRAMQKGQYARIISIDNRAAELGRGCSLPLLEDTNLPTIRKAAHEMRVVQFALPRDAIDIWRRQFLRAAGDGETRSPI